MEERWLTKTEVAGILRISERSVQNLASEGKLQSRPQSREGKAPIVVYHPSDVERVRAERQAQMVFVMPPDSASPASGQSLATAAANQGKNLEVLEAFMEAVSEKLLKPSELAHKRYLTMAEAIVYTGCGRSHIQARCKPHPIGPRGAKVFKRTELDKL